jgi:UDP-N-acetylglucosamine 2-epimerase (non-hydrolysing)
MTLNIVSVVESRSGLFKIAALSEAIRRSKRFKHACSSFRCILVHTGKPGSSDASDLYFNDIELPKPDLFLGAAPCASSLENSGAVAQRFSDLLCRESPEIVIITGDSDCSLDCALVTKRISDQRPFVKVPTPDLAVFQVESNNRSRTRSRQVNSAALAVLADYLFTSEAIDTPGLSQQRPERGTTHIVGNLKMDMLLRYRAQAMASSILSDLQLATELEVKPFGVVVLRHLSHSYGVFEFQRLHCALAEIARQMPVVLPANAVVLRCIQEAGLEDYFVDHFVNEPEGSDARVRIRLTPPLGYLDFVKLAATAQIVLTDCAGVQEQSALLGVRCIFLSDGLAANLTSFAKDRPITDPEGILEVFYSGAADKIPLPPLPACWDGRAAERTLEVLLSGLNVSRLRKKRPTDVSMTGL